MSCAAFAALADAALDATLAPDERRALESHQALCRDCRERSAEILGLTRLLARHGREGEPGFPLERAEELFAHVDADRSSALQRLAGILWGRLPVPSLTSSAALLVLLGALALRPAPAGSARGFAAPSGQVPAAPRRQPAPAGGLLTVWDSKADTIVAAFDPAGLAGHGAACELGIHRLALGPARPGEAGVRIFLYERIFVHE